MSNYQAIATVTAVLKNSLQIVAGSIGSATVSTSPLDMITRSNTSALVNLYMYQVEPNTALSNADLPTRRADISGVQRPQAALELRYLISFYGKESDLEPQRLLGKVTASLRGRPLITRKAIRDTLGNAHYLYLAGSDLEHAVETVRLTPLPLSLEEMARLWSLFPQTPYALSVAYNASVVLIEAEEPAGPALPVRDYRLYAGPSSRPIIHAIEAESGARDPILPDSVLMIRGENLLCEITLARVAGFEVPITGEPRQLRLPISALQPAALRAGVLGLQVVHPRLMGDPPTPHMGADSNLAGFTLHPSITGGPFDLPATATVSLSLAIQPPVRAGQRAALLLTGMGGEQLRAIRVEIPPEGVDRASLDVTLPRPPLGRYLVRVVVEGAESIPSYDPALPGFSGPLAVRTPRVSGTVTHASGTLKIPLGEEVLPGQEVQVRLYQQPADAEPAHTLAPEPISVPTEELEAAASGVPTGTYWVRVIVDSATSDYETDASGPVGPKVDIP